MTGGQRPSINRAVHYQARGSADGKFPPVCRAAVITEVGDMESDRVGLCVMNPTGMFFYPVADGGGVAHDEDKAPGTWHWPERI